MFYYVLVCILLFVSLLIVTQVFSDSHVLNYFDGVLLAFFIYYIRAIFDDEKLEKMYVKEHDERNQEIDLKATSATLRLSVLALAGLSMYYAFHDYAKMQLISIILWMVLIIKLIVTMYYKKKL